MRGERIARKRPFRTERGCFDGGGLESGSFEGRNLEGGNLEGGNLEGTILEVAGLDFITGPGLGFIIGCHDG